MKKQTPRSPEEILQILELFKCWQKPGEFIPLLNEIKGLIVPEKTIPQYGKRKGPGTQFDPVYPVLIEIGTYTGGTAAAFSEYCRHVFSVDRNRQLVGASNVHYITGDSHAEETFKELIETMGREMGMMRADILFIDGDHSLDGTIKDFNDYSPLIRRGGLVAFHDIVDSPEHREQGCEVATFWNQLKLQYEHVEYITEPLHWGGIGIIKLPI